MDEPHAAATPHRGGAVVRRLCGLWLPCYALVLPGLLACSFGQVEREQPNIIFIVVDTLRKDHVGVYGYRRDTTPFLDSLAETGLVFDAAIAQSSWTLPSVMSLFTSMYPAKAVQRSGGTLPRLSDEATTLAEQLHGAGYQTFSVTTNPYHRDAFNLMQGFEVREWKLSGGADWVVDAAIRRLKESASQPLRGAHGEHDGHSKPNGVHSRWSHPGGSLIR